MERFHAAKKIYIIHREIIFIFMFIKLSIDLCVYPILSYPIPSIDDIVIGRCWVDLCGFIGS